MTDLASNFAVEVKDLSAQFGSFFAVNHISFTVNRGEIFGFLGANGAGKTTTIRVLCGLLIPTTGTVFVAGTNLHDGEMAIKSKVGYMSQKFTLYNDMTVEENLDFIASLRRIERRVYLGRRQELFNFISFDRPIKTIVQDLPGGIKQQVSLAAALLHDPEIIFLDEPTAGVSPAARARFWALIRQLAGKGKTVFVTTHYMDEAEQCGRIALMRDGKIIALNTPDGLKKETFPTDVLFFEPYGLRFHAAARSAEAWNEVKSKYEKQFTITKIKPSLEDVFIRSVEAGTQ